MSTTAASSSTSESRTSMAPWLWVAALGWSALIIGVALWVTVATGQGIALILALGLVAPIDVMMVRRWHTSNPRRRE